MIYNMKTVAALFHHAIDKNTAGVDRSVILFSYFYIKMI